MEKTKSTIAVAVALGVLALMACSSDTTDEQATSRDESPAVETTAGASEPTDSPEPDDVVEDEDEGTRDVDLFEFSEEQALDEDGFTVSGMSQPASVPIVVGADAIDGLTGEPTGEYLPVVFELVGFEYGDWSEWEDIVGHQFSEEMTPVYVRYTRDESAFDEGQGTPGWAITPSAVTSDGGSAQPVLITGEDEAQMNALRDHEHCPVDLLGTSGSEACVVGFIPVGETVPFVQVSHPATGGEELRTAAWVIED